MRGNNTSRPAVPARSIPRQGQHDARRLLVRAPAAGLESERVGARKGAGGSGRGSEGEGGGREEGGTEVGR